MSVLDCAVIAACLVRSAPTLRRVARSERPTRPESLLGRARRRSAPARRPQAQYRIGLRLYRGGALAITLTSATAQPYVCAGAQMAELVDALVSGTSGESRGGSSPLLGTIRLALSLPSEKSAMRR